MPKVETIHDRIKILVEEYGEGKNTVFASLIGSNEGNIRGYIKGVMPKQDILESIVRNIDISAEWLLTGQGSMLKEAIKKVSVIQEKEIKEETRPRIPMDAAAGSLTIAADGITINDCEQIPIIRAFAKYDFTIFARGDSMLPEYHSGDELACVYIKDTSFVQWGRIHVVDTAQGILVKRIFDGGDCIICKSDNPDYPEFKVSKSEFYNVALVIGMLRRY